ncbi:MAG: hypothetical protein A2086_00840 [Spirochaetes bacterium GWD1_27_9]|nr:MAG: hypothetical protein A2Z98_08835 [Spirochaetes bacterium GWB1_27_13]OHD28077.1 MAG: hypothetical protein A2Y34_02730 [Spirochaetes bacterium GWC1_27_15]OHD32554.1 MAG: hypothetical protein A2086_00840 [Spirochaetes bacterium GWD1_27_9]
MKTKILIVFLFINCFLFSEQQKDEPSWVYLKKAENLKEQGEYALAVIEARKAKQIFVMEKIENLYEKLREEEKDKTNYELKKIIEEKRLELMQNDNYPQYHEIMADLYVLTNFLSEAEREYKIAIDQKKYFDYPQKLLEIKYKLASVYEQQLNYDLADITYREIVIDYFKKKKNDFWDRIRFNIKQDISLVHTFRIYRVDGIEYLKALYKIGKRASLIQKKEEALFFIANAGIVWMTYYSNLIKKEKYDFQYASPVDFINYVTKKNIGEYISEKDYLIDEIMFFIGYLELLYNEDDIAKHYFDLAIMFSKGTKRENEIKSRIDYFKRDRNHILSYEELID